MGEKNKIYGQVRLWISCRPFILWRALELGVPSGPLQLPPHQGSVNPIHLQELFMGAALSDLPLRNDRDRAGALHGGKPVRYHEDGPPLHQGIHGVLGRRFI